jgi:hypothetical protein
MCARRFLIVITILTLMVVAAAFAIFQFGGTVLRQSFTPQGQYAPPPPRTGPDYANSDTWIARPGLENNPADWLPPGVVRAESKPGAAIFYIHPTTYLKGDRWNAPLQSSESGWRDQLFVQSQASAFNGVGNIWAPRYRQAAYGSFLLSSDDARQALDLAYGDLSAAFDHFLRELEPGRPIILAGHSQGALHLMRLLVERGSELKGGLVAAYVVGWPVSLQADVPALGFPVCRTPEETGCILSWMSFGDPPNPSLILSGWQGTEGPAGERRKRKDIACVNPISGAFEGVALASQNPGTLVPTADFSSATLVEGAVGAHCHDGLLIVDGELPPLGPYVLPGNNYHVYDYALFWGAIRRDAERRLAQWQR